VILERIAVREDEGAHIPVMMPSCMTGAGGGSFISMSMWKLWRTNW